MVKQKPYKVVKLIFNGLCWDKMGKMIGQVTTYLRKIVLSKLSVPFRNDSHITQSEVINLKNFPKFEG